MEWLHCDQRRYVKFVAYRVAEVVKSAPASWWRWVPTALNVADDATRSGNLIKFEPKSRWLRGPAWLKDDETSRPKQPSCAKLTETVVEELRPKYVGVVVQRGAVEFERFSKWTRLTRCMATDSMHGASFRIRDDQAHRS